MLVFVCAHANIWLYNIWSYTLFVNRNAPGFVRMANRLYSEMNREKDRRKKKKMG